MKAKMGEVANAMFELQELMYECGVSCVGFSSSVSDHQARLQPDTLHPKPETLIAPASS